MKTALQQFMTALLNGASSQARPFARARGLRTPAPTVMRRRGPYYFKGFSGFELREMRARNGVGRPPPNKPPPYGAR